jgi:hypothetical protein
LNHVITGTGFTAFSDFVAGEQVASKLAFSQQPTTTDAGQTIAPPITVQIQDAVGEVVAADSTTNVTLAIGTNPGSGTLGGTTVRTASSGVATFDDLSINKTGNGYTLAASSSPVLTAATSNAFNITGRVTFNASSLTDVDGATNVLTVIVGGNPLVNVTKAELPKTFTGVADGNSITYSYLSPLASTTANKQNRWLSTSGTGSASAVTAQSTSFSLTSASSVTAAYQAQSLLTFAQSGLSADASTTVVTVEGNAKLFGVLPFSDYFDDGSSVTYSYGDPVSSSVSGKKYVRTSVTGSASPITVSGPATVTGNYKTQYEITFAKSGMSGDSTGKVVTINSVDRFEADLPISAYYDENAVVNSRSATRWRPR